ncbi:MAG TPA: phosphopantothenoylcysteine decarboxylase, partial [Gaiellaceae bacterium]|nr:phosphopantothenoylcysteine decarboxylase [Gaiellaceae bacterium]
DEVRYVGNRSSGRMGVALADEARRRGADVTLVVSNVTVPIPGGVALVDAPTAADVEREVLARADADVVLMAAAIADYRPAERVAGKRAKGADTWTIELERTTDVLRALGAREPHGVLVGFAAEAGEALDRARRKLTDKRANLIVFNDVSRSDIGFDSDANEVTLVTDGGERTISRTSKREVAEHVLDEVVKLLG